MEPSEAHCLACRSRQPLKDVKMVDTVFRSSKNGKEMSRKTWEGVCAKCGNRVKKFAKSEKVAPAPEPSC